MNQPKRGWTEEEARDLLRQGYSNEQIAKATGYGVDWVAAQSVPREPYHPALASVGPRADAT